MYSNVLNNTLTSSTMQGPMPSLQQVAGASDTATARPTDGSFPEAEETASLTDGYEGGDEEDHSQDVGPQYAVPGASTTHQRAIQRLRKACEARVLAYRSWMDRSHQHLGDDHPCLVSIEKAIHERFQRRQRRAARRLGVAHATGSHQGISENQGAHITYSDWQKAMELATRPVSSSTQAIEVTLTLKTY